MKAEKTVPGYQIEDALDPTGEEMICGCDEAGRGPLAGPVVAAAVILPRGLVIDGLNDSKKLSEKKREALFEVIQREAIAYAVVSVSPEEIDEMNILRASLTAMKRASEELCVVPDRILIDGNTVAGFDQRAMAVVKGDAKSASIAAASVLAKVTRDRYMAGEADRLYPEYGFAGHKGYPVPAHYAAIREHGACPIHRKTFLKKLH